MPGNRASNTFVAAVTGHTHFDAQQTERIGGLVRRTLTEIKSAVNQTLGGQFTARQRSHRGSRRPRLSVISCVAAGADQIVAEAGLQLGYRLQIVLPGPVAAYRDAMRISGDEPAQEKARATFDRLLANTPDVINLELPLPPGDKPDTAQNMLDEVIEWRVLFKFRPISSPA
jgi:hypothetical protein